MFKTNTIRQGYYTKPSVIPGRLAAHALQIANGNALWSLQTCEQCGISADERDGSIGLSGKFNCYLCD